MALFKKILSAGMVIGATAIAPVQAVQALDFNIIATHETGIFKKSAAEIVVFQKATGNIFVVNGAGPSVDVLRLDGSKTAKKVAALSLADNETPTSVAVNDKLVAVAVHDEADAAQMGKIVFFDNNNKRVGEVKAGSLPDMVTFTPNGRYVLVANEGEPTDTMDPEGSVTVIDLKKGVKKAKATQVSLAPLNEKAKKAGVRIAPGKTFAVDAEPEYIATSGDGKTAWVALQENNAIAEIDVKKAVATDIFSLGLKDHSKPGQGLDPNDKNGFNIGNHKLFGMYMPDAIASMDYKGKTYILTANEGDARDADEKKAGKANIDANAATADEIKAFKKIRISILDGDTDGDGDIDKIHSYGARSFSIFSEDGKLVYDSGDAFERITGDKLGIFFNSNNKKAAKGDSRSDNKGPEPEGITTGVIDGKTYAFIGLERVGGIMVYDVSTPDSPVFVEYINNRTYSSDFDFKKKPADVKAAGFLGPEGIHFVSAKDSPTGKPLLMVAYEVSGNVAIMEIN